MTKTVENGRAGAIKTSDSNVTIKEVTPTVVGSNTKASKEAMVSGGVTWGTMETVKMK